MFRMAWW